MIEKLFSVKDKLILITGSSQGIGLSLAKGFAEAKAKVIINGRNLDRINSALNQLKKINQNTIGIDFDIKNRDQVEKKILEIESRIGAIDVLINNAGIHRRASLEELSLDDWNEVLETNLTSVFFISQCVAKNMIKRRSGRIINITSLNAEMARPTIANYCAAKAGLKMLTKSMATEWAKYNILTNAIGPGYFITELTKPLSENREFDDWVKKEVPLGRWGNTNELIGSAIFLASDASNYINGQTIYIDGGWQACL